MIIEGSSKGYTIAEASKIAGCNQCTMYAWIRQDQLKAYKAGSRLLVDPDVLTSFLETRRTQPFRWTKPTKAKAEDKAAADLGISTLDALYLNELAVLVGYKDVADAVDNICPRLTPRSVNTVHPEHSAADHLFKQEYAQVVGFSLDADDEPSLVALSCQAATVHRYALGLLSDSVIALHEVEDDIAQAGAWLTPAHRETIKAIVSL